MGIMRNMYTILDGKPEGKKTILKWTLGKQAVAA
jgi:hypothetical protein